MPPLKFPLLSFSSKARTRPGYLRITREVVEQQGIPLSIYRDQHSTFQRNDAHWSVGRTTGRQPGAHSVGPLLARVGNHLWRTFQDRLTSELRLAGACTLEQANAALERFLPEYNQQFAKSAQRASVAYRKLDARLDLDYIFALNAW